MVLSGPFLPVKIILIMCFPLVVERRPTSDHAGAAVDGDGLSGDVARGVRREQDSEPLEIFVAAQAAGGRSVDEHRAGGLDQTGGHLRRETARAAGINGAAVY